MNFLEKCTVFIMPLILVCVAFMLLLSKRELVISFMDGAREGMATCINLLPTLLLIMCGVSALFSSGGVDVLCSIFRPVLTFLGVPEELLPSIILRPFSGSGVTAVADRLFKEIGADSYVAKTACLLMGATDTIIYTLSVYFSAANIKKTRYALPASFVVFLFSIIVSVLIGRKLL
ncbi:MAG: hypothetical protein J6E38_03470 [Clostridia bacterium]|nr:hypothetical protein [Clostridia bacterium]